jgi:hypothetical protein
MSQIHSSPPICPKCHKTMTLMLTKDERERVLHCMDFGQLDPMQNAETQGWLSGELGRSALSQKE